MMVHRGEPDGLERQPAEAPHGLVGVAEAPADVLQKLAKGLFVHGAIISDNECG